MNHPELCHTLSGVGLLCWGSELQWHNAFTFITRRLICSLVDTHDKMGIVDVATSRRQQREAAEQFHDATATQ